MDTSRGSRKAIVLVFTVFALGIALGAIGMYVVTSRVQAARVQSSQGPQRNPGNAVAKMTKELDLTADQQKAIEAILNDTQAEYAAIHTQADPQYEQVRQQGRQRIRQVLTADQGPKFEDILRKMDEERRKRQAEGR